MNNNNLLTFIRTERRDNKRRYSRIRVFSRTSFGAGMCLSTAAVFSTMLTNATYLEWNGAAPTVTSSLEVLMVIYVILVLRGATSKGTFSIKNATNILPKWLVKTLNLIR